MEEWRSIPGFENYAVSDQGRVMNLDTDYFMALTRNQRGILMVGLVRDGVQYKRSVTVLVADAFLEPHKLPAFDTPVNLDGDRTNNEVENLVWRPRWFAVKYAQQFYSSERGFLVPIEDIATGETFPTSWEAATKYGLLDREILTATINHTFVWPTYQRFRVLGE